MLDRDQLRLKRQASGEKKEETEWHRVVFRGKLADVADQYLKRARAAVEAAGIEPIRIAGG